MLFQKVQFTGPSLCSNQVECVANVPHQCAGTCSVACYNTYHSNIYCKKWQKTVDFGTQRRIIVNNVKLFTETNV